MYILSLCSLLLFFGILAFPILRPARREEGGERGVNDTAFQIYLRFDPSPTELEFGKGWVLRGIECFLDYPVVCCSNLSGKWLMGNAEERGRGGEWNGMEWNGMELRGGGWGLG